MALSRSLSIVVACAAAGAEAASLVANDFSQYSGYAGQLTSVSGVVTVGQSAGNEVVLWYNLTGADPLCQGAATEANACGVHIHEGTSCDEAGGHYWVGGGDPWKTVRYEKNDNGDAFTGTNLIVKAGTTQAENNGKTIVIHDASGARIACSILVEDVRTAGTTTAVAGGFSKYPGYSGSLAVAGNVTLKQTPSADDGAIPALFMEYSLENVDPQCLTSASRSKGNACGIHVHIGNCTSNEVVAGHYWDKDKVAADPWAQVVYFSDANGKTGDTISVQIGAGVTVESMVGRSIVVHDMTGSRVACSPVDAFAKTVLTSDAPALGMQGIFAGAALSLLAGLTHEA